MEKVLRHIALLALLVFIYPITFMTFHVLHDHLPADVCSHSCCGHANQPDTGDKQETTKVEENTHCLLCEYEFAKTETTRTNLIFQENYSTNIFCEGLCARALISFTGTNKSLRAPPFKA